MCRVWIPSRSTPTALLVFSPRPQARAGPTWPPSPPRRKDTTDEARTQDLTDEELDAWILARLKSLGVDLGVLPQDDPDAPAGMARRLDVLDVLESHE